MDENKTSQTNNTPESMTPIEIIEQCGRLKYPVEKVLNILYANDNSTDIAEMRRKLNDAGTREYRAYRSAFDSGDMAVDSALHDAAADGDPDAQKALRDIQAERTVGDAIKERFFPSDDSNS